MGYWPSITNYLIIEININTQLLDRPLDKSSIPKKDLHECRYKHIGNEGRPYN